MKRFAHLVSCGLASSVFFAGVLAQLFYMLNPSTEWSPARLAGLLCSLYWPYGVAPFSLTIIGFYLVQFLVGRRLETWWLSVPILAWSFAVNAVIAILLFVRNAMLYQAFVSTEGIDAVVAGIMSWTAFMIAMVLTGSYHHFFPKMRWRKAGLTLLVLAVLALAVPGLVPPPENRGSTYAQPSKERGPLPPTRGRLVLIGLEGASLNYILPLVSQGRLPNFEELMRRGAGGRLQTITPAQSRPLWASVLTGRSPASAGVPGEHEYLLNLCDAKLRMLPRGIFFQSVLERAGSLHVQNADVLQRNTICYWDFFRAEGGLSASIIDLWAPIRSVHGSLIEYPALAERRRIYPPAIAPAVEEAVTEARAEAAAHLAGMFGESVVPSGAEWQRQTLGQALENDEIVRHLAGRFDADVLAFRLRGLDAVAHFFPASFAGESYRSFEETDGVFERAVERYYRYYDEILGEYLDSLPKDTLLCVVSIHGMEPLPVWRRMLEVLRGGRSPVGGHESGPDGFVYFYGADVARGIVLRPTTLYSILPTLLYYQGIAIGLDMRGKILLDVFNRSFRETHPASYIPSHQSGQ